MHQSNSLLTRRGVLRLLFALGPPALLAACARFDEESFLVEMIEGNQFAPATVVVPRGGQVVWHNKDRLVHTVTADPALAQNPRHVLLPDSAPVFSSGDINPGDAWSYTFDVPGDYIYFCRYHESREMIGRITVGE